MQLCLMVEGQEGVSWPQWVALAHACERHGIPGLFLSDHYSDTEGSPMRRGALDAWGTICALAAVTSTVRLGTLVSPATFRHPSVLARLVATADGVAQGRIDLGIGAGWMEREHLAHGFPFAPTRTRLEVLEEQLQILRGSWADAPFSFDGRHYRLRDLEAWPKPVQRPRPPIILGGSGGPRSAALAVRWADEYNTPLATPAQIRERLEVVDGARERAGRETLPFSVMAVVLVGEDARRLGHRMRRLAHRTASGALARGLSVWRARRLVAAPPPHWIIGTVDDVAEQLIALRDAGVSRVMCRHPLPDDLDAVALIGERLAPLVA